MTILDFIPLPLLFILTIAIVLVAVEAGFRLGVKHSNLNDNKAPVSTMVGSALGLLAFMLAFTFGMAGSRFENRKALVVDDANAIFTSYLRSAFVDEPYRAEIRKLLREYVDIRIEAATHAELQNKDVLNNMLQIQNRLWAISEEVWKNEKGANSASLLAQSMNEIFNTHNKRLSLTFTNRIPGTIWLVLYSILFFSMGVVGYYAGLLKTHSRVVAVVLAVAFSSIMFLIDDLDRPQQGFLKVNQQAMINLRDRMDSINVKAPDTRLKDPEKVQ